MDKFLLLGLSFFPHWCQILLKTYLLIKLSQYTDLQIVSPNQLSNVYSIILKYNFLFFISVYQNQQFPEIFIFDPLQTFTCYIIISFIMESNPKSKQSFQQQQQNTSEYHPNLFTKQFELSQFIGFKCTHISFFLCWFGLVLAGTTIIGYGASSFSSFFQYCQEGEPFCFYDLTLDQNRDLYVYSKVSPYYQNNRMYTDSFSINQLMGYNGSGSECGSYKTYDSFGISTTAGGYRKTPKDSIHPCGFPFLSLFDDSLYIIQGDGGSPKLDINITSNYSKTYRFKRHEKYQITQWTDVQHPSLMNWMTIGTTSTKYTLMGKLNNMSAGDYRLIVKNNFEGKGDFTKELVVSQVNSLGLTNHLTGFTLFAYGIGVLLVHVGICCKSKQ